MQKPIRFKSKLLSIEEINHKLRYLRFGSPDNFSFKPGQYVLANIPTESGKTLKRQYSLANPPGTKGYFELIITLVDDGPGSSYFFGLNEGDEVDFMGPMGLFTIREGELEQGATFISTGTGIAPFRSIVQDLAEKSCPEQLTIIAGYRYEEDALFEDEFKELSEKCKNFNYYQILSKPRDPKYTGFKGHVELLVHHAWDQIKDNTFYLCGLKEMVEETRNLLLSKGVAKEKIRFERYD